ncbi:MAG: phosphate signaling complex protein PhoU [Candidatus Firestonebacteria bacterium]
MQEKIEAIKKEITAYASFIDNMVENSVKGFYVSDEKILNAVINDLEPFSNDEEIKMDEVCVKFIAQQQPAGKNLRTIIMTLRMTNDLERMGDHAVNISESALFLIKNPVKMDYKDIKVMADETIKMLRNSLQAFMTEDAALAKKVCENDDVVDDLRERILREIVLLVGKEPESIEQGLHVVRIIGNLERIADLTTNICEDVIFIAEGTSIKHNKNI